MKKSVNNGVFPSGLSLAECFKLAKAAGLDGVELTTSDEGGIINPGTPEAEVKEIGKLAQEAGIEISSFCSGGWRVSLTSNDKSVREKGKDYFRKMLDFAVILGVDTVLLVPGRVDEETPYDVAYERAKEAVYELKHHAEKVEVSLAVENVWNKFLLSPLEMRDFIDAMESEYVGAYFDVGNVLISGYPEQWIRILGKRIRKVHIKDFKTSIGSGLGFCNLLEGDVPWGRVIEALREIGYDDYLVAELPPYQVYQDLTVYHISQCMDRIIAGK